MNSPVRIILVVLAAIGNLLICRAAYKGERNQSMSLPLTLVVGVILLTVYSAIASLV